MDITISKKPKKLFTRPTYTIEEAAEILRVHPNTLYRLCRSGKLGAFRSGEGKRASWRIPGEGLEALRVPEPEKRRGAKAKKEGGAE